MSQETINRYYSCVNDKCKLEGNHVHVDKDTLAIPKDKNYLDITNSHGHLTFKAIANVSDFTKIVGSKGIS